MQNSPDTNDAINEGQLAGIDEKELEFCRDLSESFLKLQPKSAHLSVQDLQNTVAKRRSQKGAWQMPEHLSQCPICLDAFSALLENQRMSISSVIFNRLLPSHLRPALHLRVLHSNITRFAMAACLVLCLGTLLFFNNRSITIDSITGQFEFSNGSLLRDSNQLPLNKKLLAKQDSTTTFQDHSKIEVSKGSNLVFYQSLKGSTTVHLNHGSLEAKVSPQTEGRTFNVSTPLGTVTVVGTAFKVTCRKETVEVFNSDDGLGLHRELITVVDVTVTEGTVKVGRGAASLLVHAGEAALMRSSSPHIELSKTK